MDGWRKTSCAVESFELAPSDEYGRFNQILDWCARQDRNVRSGIDQHRDVVHGHADGSLARGRNGVGSRFRAMIYHMVSGLPEKRLPPPIVGRWKPRLSIFSCVAKSKKIGVSFAETTGGPEAFPLQRLAPLRPGSLSP